MNLQIESMPQINNKKLRGRDATIPDLTEEIFNDIIQNHKHSTKHWEKQLQKVA